MELNIPCSVLCTSITMIATSFCLSSQDLFLFLFDNFWDIELNVVLSIFNNCFSMLTFPKWKLTFC